MTHSSQQRLSCIFGLQLVLVCSSKGGGLSLLTSQNTNCIVKAEQLLFGNVVINRVRYILWRISPCQRASVSHCAIQLCVLYQTLHFLHLVTIQALLSVLCVCAPSATIQCSKRGPVMCW